MAGKALLLAALTTLAFSPVLFADFVAWDDLDALARNPDFNPPSLRAVAQFWTDWRQGYRGFYVPVLYTFWSVAAAAQGPSHGPGEAAAGINLDPTLFHACSLASHVLNAVLVFAILRRLVGADWPAWLGALLFAVHPLQAEPVAWASTFYTPLSATFALAAVWLYLEFVRLTDPAPAALSRSDALGPPPAARARRGWACFGLATLAYVLALLTKPTVVVLPLIVAVIERLARRRAAVDMGEPRDRATGRIRRLLPLGLWLLLAAMDAWVTRRTQSAPTVFAPAPAQRLLVAVDSLAFYLNRLLFPFHLIPDYGRTPQWVLLQWRLHPLRLIAAWTTPAALIAVACAAWRKWPWLAAGAVIFLLGVVTTLGLLPFDYQIYSTVADRYAYLAMLGAAVVVAFASERAAAYAAARWRDRRATGRTWLGAAALLATLGVMTLMQCAYWHDTFTLFDHTLSINPRSLAAHRALTFALAGQGRLGEAFDHCNQALEMAPDDPILLQYKGNLLLTRSEWAEASDAFRRALAIKPQDDGLYDSLGIALSKGGRLPEAVTAFKAALRLNPDYAAAHANLGNALLQQHELGAAAAEYRRALELDPNDRVAQAGLQWAHAARAGAGRAPATEPHPR